jgi:hypothetical protein
MKLAVTSDVFRCQEFSCCSVAFNRSWLQGFVTSIRSNTVLNITAFAPISEGGCFDAEAYRIRMDLPQTAAGWALAASMRIPETQEDLFLPLLQNSCVISFGLPPSLCELLSRNRIPYVDFEVDSARFARDLFLVARTNIRAVADALDTAVIPDEVLYASAAAIRAFYARRDSKTVHPSAPFALFAGQSKVDLSLVSCGLIAEPEAYLEEIAKASAPFPELLVKPHPYEPDTTHIERITSHIPTAHLSSENIYRLLSDINLKTVISLSSSVLVEAKFFGVRSTPLIRNDAQHSELLGPVGRQRRRVSAALLCPQILRKLIFSAAHSEPPPTKEDLKSSIEVDLRGQIRAHWGLETVQHG